MNIRPLFIGWQGADGPNVHFHEVYADTGMCWQAAAGDAIDGKDKIIKPTKTKTKKEKKDKTDDAPKSSASKASKNKVDDDKAQPKLMAFMQQQQQHERATHVPSNAAGSHSEIPSHLRP